MDARPLRLPPGADLRRAVEEIAAAEWPHGAFVLCGIGSLVDPCLRLAGNDAPTRYAGAHEILTLTGSVTRDGAHLHMSIAGAGGAVVGGHVTAGNVVRTTVELLIVTAAGWSLRRLPDAATGYPELVVSSAPPPAAPRADAPPAAVRSATGARRR